MSADQTILLQCPIDGSVFLEVLKGVGRPAKRVGHVESKEKKSKRGINAYYKGSVRGLSERVELRQLVVMSR
jgi:hypothetical protein